MRSREELATAFAAALEGEDRTVLEELQLPELRTLVDALREPGAPPRNMNEANVALADATTLIPAQPGWRLAVLGPDEDLEACPIVAWTPGNTEPLTLEPIALYHSQDGLGAAALYSGRPDRIVGIIAPGEEVGNAWINAGEELAKALREQEEREARTVH